MARSGRRGDPDEFFEILVTSYGQRSGGAVAEQELCWRPPTDVYETETEFVVQMDLAGMDPTQIQVDLDGSSLVIRGIRAETAEPGRKHFHTMEINMGPFVRRVPVIEGVDPNSAEARYRGGFLFVSFQKGERRQSPRRQIAIDR
jgi:HSP20 family protein